MKKSRAHFLRSPGSFGISRKLTREQFAHNLSKEWAALPAATGDKPYASYYDGDGLNKVRVALTDVYASMDQLRQ